MSTDDPFDDELRSRLRQATSGQVDDRAVLESLRPRLGRARRRHHQRVALAASAPVVVALAILGSLALSGGTSQPVRVRDSQVGDRPSATTAASTVPPTSTTLPTSTTSAPAPTAAPDGTDIAPVNPPVTTGVPGTPSPTSPTPPPSAPTSTAPVGDTRTLTSDGGTATVTWTSTSLTVDSTQPGAGWTLEQTEQKSPTRVVVRFRRDGGGSGSSTATIDARVTNGRLESSN